MADAQTSAIARLDGATLATRNLRDFNQTGIEVINPWDNRAAWARSPGGQGRIVCSPSGPHRAERELSLHTMRTGIHVLRSSFMPSSFRAWLDSQIVTP